MKMLALVGLVVAVLGVAMGLFPPWLVTVVGSDRTVPFGYHFIAHKRSAGEGQSLLVFSIDLARLIVQWVLLLFAGSGIGAIFILFRRSRSE